MIDTIVSIIVLNGINWISHAALVVSRDLRSPQQNDTLDLSANRYNFGVLSWQIKIN